MPSFWMKKSFSTYSKCELKSVQACQYKNTDPTIEIWIARSAILMNIIFRLQNNVLIENLSQNPACFNNPKTLFLWTVQIQMLSEFLLFQDWCLAQGNRVILSVSWMNIQKMDRVRKKIANLKLCLMQQFW